MAPYLISDVRVFDGDSVLYDHGYILTENNLIKAVSLEKPALLPSDTTVVEGSGCTILPGLIDAHVHAFNHRSLLTKAIQYGVTTVIDMHNEPDWFQGLKKIANERNNVSDIKSVCHAATIRNGWPAPIVKMTSSEPDIDDRISRWPNITDDRSAEEYVLKNAAAGASYIKLMQESGHAFDLPVPGLPNPTPSLGLQRAIVNAAHKHNMLTVAHAFSTRDTLQVLEAGVDGLVHACSEAPSQELVDAFTRIRAFVVPTLVAVASVSGEEQESREKFARRLEQDERDHMCGCLKIGRPGFSTENAIETVKALKTAGTEIVCGSDTSEHIKGLMAGASLHHELWLYVQRCGLTPVEALRSATSVTARCFRLPDRGRIQEGLKADLVLVRGDPTESIDCLEEIVGVWRNGERLAAAKD